MTIATGSVALLASAVAHASPAYAVDAEVTCEAAGANTNVTMAVGGSYTIRNTSSVGRNCALSGTGTSVSWVSDAGPTVDPTGSLSGEILTVTGFAVGTSQLTFPYLPRGSRIFTFTVTEGGADGSASSTPPLTQQFGKPASGTCLAAAPVGLNWGGVPSGGWGESWARWMNNGTGGFVCTRTLAYSYSLGGWTVQP